MKPEVKLEPLPFAEAIKFFKGKLPMSSTKFATLADEARAKAFSIAKQQNWLILAGTQAAITRALAEGTTFGEFRKEINALFDRLGVTRLNRYHAELVFRNNITTAYQAGRYQQMTDPEVRQRRPYWTYHAVKDTHTRKTHLDQNRKTYPADHPFWAEWYPPNGFNCRCTVTSVSEAEVKAEGLRISTEMPADHPDPGWWGGPTGS